ncbi:MAG: T9SS C-terminal target domain-containing protein [Calditrichaeota bacterium]|nr:MAG: T9SS C-terminal target domain-containing protein [Calditrichota bacterium]
MKKLITLISLILISQNLFAQAGVTIIPSTPSPGDLVTIQFDPTQNNEMPNNASEMVLHWGINGFTLPPTSTWPTGSVNFQNAAVRSPMTLNGSVWETQIQTDATFNVLDFVFNDGTPTTTGTNWAHDTSVNPPADWHIAITGGFYPNVEWFPSNPDPNDTLTVVIKNATQGGVIHWGVNGFSDSGVFPPYIPPNSTVQGIAVQTQLFLQPNGDYHATLKPFKLPNQVVKVVDFAINWTDGTWDNNNYQDYHIPINLAPKSGDAVVEITNLDENDVVDSLSQNINITASNQTQVQFWVNGSLKTTLTGSSPYTYSWDTSTLPIGKSTIVAAAWNSVNRVTFDAMTVWKVPAITYGTAPSVEQGVTDNGNGTATFSLFAPNTAFNSVIGSFNNWDATAGLMNYDSTQSIWWKTETLANGTYQYQYRINGTKNVADPFSFDVEWKNAQGNETGNFADAKTVFEMGATPFVWNDQNYQRPALRDLNIYELHIGDFSSTKDFAGVIAKLDYLQDLGINAIEFLPHYEFPGAISWGYNPAFYLAPESVYGTPNDLKMLVDEAHQRGIAILADIVLNHVDGSSPINQIWDNVSDNPYVSPLGNPWGFPDLDHDNQATKDMSVRVMKHWLQEYHFDGFRYDATQFIGWSGYDTFGVSYFTKQIFDFDSTAYQICEHLPQETNLILNTEAQSTWHDTFHDQMKANLREGSFEGGTYPNLAKTAQGIHFQGDGFTDASMVVNYTESHDEQRVIFEAQTNPNINLQNAIKKSKLGAAVLFTSAGIPMMYHGQEFGEDTERTIDPNPLHWNKLNEPVGSDLHTFFKRMLWLRNNYDALRSNNLFTTDQLQNENIIIYRRSGGTNGDFVIVANLSNQDHTIDFQATFPGTWYEYITDTQVQTSGTNIDNYFIPASSARIFVSNKIWTDIEETENNVIPLEFDLSQNFPNPFNPSTQINFTISENSFVKLNVYNVLGQKVKTLVNEQRKAGNFSTHWNGTNELGKQVSSGVYFYKLETSNGDVKSQKMLLIK